MQGQSPCPPAAAGGTLLCSNEIRKGVRGGNPITGLPPLSLRPYVYAFPFVAKRYALLPFRPHFFGACPKKRCRAVKEKRFVLIFTIAGRTRRWQCLSVVSANQNAPFAPGEGEVVGNLAVDAPGGLRRGRTCRPDGQGNCLRQVQHNVRPAIKKIRTKCRFSLGLTPFLLARAKEMGCLAAGPHVTAHT